MYKKLILYIINYYVQKYGCDLGRPQGKSIKPRTGSNGAQSSKGEGYWNSREESRGEQATLRDVTFSQPKLTSQVESWWINNLRFMFSHFLVSLLARASQAAPEERICLPAPGHRRLRFDP